MGWSKDYGKSAKVAADRAEAERLLTEAEREATEAVRLETLAVKNANKTKWLPPVATVALRNSTYPNPQNGDTVKVTGESAIYRFDSVSGWVKTDEYNPTAIDGVTAQLADMPTKDYVTEKIVEVNTGGTVDISSKASVTYVNELAGINAYSTVPTFTNGVLTQVEELDGTIVKKRTSITYNADGTVNTVTDVTEGKTVISTMNYVNGVFASVTNQLIEGGL